MAEKNEVKDAYPPQNVKNLQNIFILTKMFPLLPPVDFKSQQDSK